MRVIPLAEELYPDPEEVTREQIRDWEDNPVTRLLVARLRQAAHRQNRFTDVDDMDELALKAATSIGFDRAVAILQAILNSKKRDKPGGIDSGDH